MIFLLLDEADDKDLLACRRVCTLFQDWIDKKTSLWSRMSLRRAVSTNNIDCLRLIMKYSRAKNDYIEETPMHWAAVEGNLEICQILIDTMEDKNPGDWDQVTPLHLAAQKGHLEVCRMITSNVEDKSPRTTTGLTPLHEAACYGHLEVCQLFLEMVENKNPRALSLTP